MSDGEMVSASTAPAARTRAWRPARLAAALAALASLVACSEEQTSGQATDVGSDVGSDVAADAASSDAAADAVQDAASDSAVDDTSDASQDTGAETTSDSAADADAEDAVDGPPSASYTIDQLTHDGITGSLPTFMVGQTFAVPTTATLKRIDVWAEARLAGDALPSKVTVEVFAVAAGLPTGAALAASAIVEVPAVGGMQAFAFATTPTLQGGQTYAFVVTCVAPNEVNVGVAGDAPYPGGTQVWNLPEAPTAVTASDMQFQVVFDP